MHCVFLAISVAGLAWSCSRHCASVSEIACCLHTTGLPCLCWLILSDMVISSCLQEQTAAVSKFACFTTGEGTDQSQTLCTARGILSKCLGVCDFPGVGELHVCANLKPRPFHPSIIRFANSTLVSFSQREGRWSKTVGKKFTV